MRTARVKVSTADGSVAIGHCLTAANLTGHGPAWRTRPLDGMVVGVAMTPAANGLVWVLVNPQ
jgi:hypothetical protein